MRKTSYSGKHPLSKAQYMSAKYYAMRYPEWEKAGDTEKVDIIQAAAKEADEEIYEYIIKSAIRDVPFYQLQQEGIPCGSDKFYKARRKFYFILARRI